MDRDSVDAYEGFEVHPAYDDFSTPTFDGKHNIFKGGCWASTGNYAIKDARYAFRRHFYQHSGFRYIQAEPLPEIRMNVYEKDDTVAQYIEFHYGDSYFGVPNFPVACISEATRHLTVVRPSELWTSAARRGGQVLNLLAISTM